MSTRIREKKAIVHSFKKTKKDILRKNAIVQSFKKKKCNKNESRKSSSETKKL